MINRVMVDQAIIDIAAYCGIDYSRNIFRFQLRVKMSARLDEDIRVHLAEAMTAGDTQRHPLLEAPLHDITF